MTQAGLPLVTALAVLARQGSKRAHLTAARVLRLIHRGDSLGEALARSGVAFPAVHLALIRSGELSGQLDRVLDRLAAMAEGEVALRAKIRSAMLYPLMVLLVALVVLLFMVLFVVPSFAGIFRDLHAELPLATRILLQVAAVVRAWGHVGAGLLVALVAGALLWARTPGGRRSLDGILLRVPVLGTLAGYQILGRLTRGLALLLGGGIPLLEALDAAGTIAGNSLYARALIEARQGVARGESLAESLRYTGVIPDFVVEMVRVGEQAGSVEAMLTSAADAYDRQAAEMVANLTSLLEPVLLVVIGGLVGVMVLALLLPVLSLLGAVEAGV